MKVVFNITLDIGSIKEFRNMHSLVFKIYAVLCLVPCISAKELNCRFKKGCTADRCDPIPGMLNQRNSNVVEFLKRKEFPIACEDTDDGSEAAKRMLATVTDNQEEEFKKEQERMQNQMAELEIRIMKLEKENEELTASFAEFNNVMKKTCKDKYDGIEYGEVCLWAEIHTDYNTNRKNAELICNKKDSTLADIHSKRQYDIVTAYIRKKISKNNERTYTILWTGMTRDYSTNDAILSTGQVAIYKKLIPAPSLWTEGSRSRTRVYLKVDLNSNSDDQGYGAIWDTWTYHGALCQSY